MEAKDLTIIVPSLVNADLEKEDLTRQSYALENCWKSLDETAPDVPKILVTNGGDPITYKKRTQIHNWRQGQNMAVNAAVATVNTKYIMITNDDMVYPPGWWEKVSSWYGTLFHPETDTVSPVLVEPQAGAPTFEVYPCGGAGGDFDKEKFLEYDKNHEKSEEGTRSGFNLPFIISKKMWDLIGGYDINYDPWGSNGDSDLEYKVKLAGGQSIQIVDWRVYHFSQTSGTFLPANDKYRFANYAYFKEKWGFDRTDDGIWEATFTIPDKERIYFPAWEGTYERKG